ncbi:hypothetical protein M3P21_06045 [Ruegeria sp. 2012CJ41-6]|uniref:Lipoprotein n=1 Tax=Ruegeria spongiae TaxID=2942209 RepID=A0ABT0PZM5_9RHOB|nr:hypothetical protein [Ruegeria spongiae]MCL6283090.1 hypothetical protein [Ruegeria spongiae]
MNFYVGGLLLFLALPGMSSACELAWPKASVPVPPHVQSYIVKECSASDGVSDVSVQACVHGERFGYRVVVTMLKDARIGARAAERYRLCNARQVGNRARFHRRMALCIGEVFECIWWFEQAGRRPSVIGRRVGALPIRMLVAG